MDFIELAGIASVALILLGVALAFAIAVRIAVPDETRDDLDDPSFYTTEDEQ